MRLYAYVMEAKDLPPMKNSVGLPNAYAKLKVGKHKSRTRTVRRSLDPVWNEEFVFRVEEEEEEELEVGLFYEVDSGEGELLGSVNVPIRRILDEGTQTLPPTWFSLQPEGGAVSALDCGKILLTISLCGRSNNFVIHSPPRSNLSNNTCVGQPEVPVTAPLDIPRGTDCSTMASMDESMPVVEETRSAQAFSGHQAERFINNEKTFTGDSRNHDSSELSDRLSARELNNDSFSSFSFEKVIGIMQSRDGTKMPENLQGGILLDQTYMIEPKDMNAFLFEPNSQFRRALAERQGTTDYQEGLWTWKGEDMPCLTRSVSYTKAATKFVKAVKATEEQSYLKADGKNFAVLVQVSTLDVPYGNCFQVDLLYKLMSGPQLTSGEECSHLVVSWNINFYQSIVMKSIIEGTARQGLKESYETFADLLAQYIKPVSSTELILEKHQLLAPLQLDHQSDWELAIEYLCNFTVIATIFMGLYVLLHILLSGPGTIQGLEFNGLNLPDTFGELITCGILVLQGERVFKMVSHFVKARLQRGSDHGIKAQGDGWLVTVALIEGSNLPIVASSGFSDPYVVFNCNGQTRTSSVQLQTRDPQWNEILEFDAMQEPPSVLDAEVFDFDGPFDLEVSLGHAEINFLKHTSAELADMWVPLGGKLAQTSQSKLHLRIFLDNTKGAEAIREFLSKMEREVGKKLNLRSPHRNSTFQRLFALPPEEFLINDFSCYLKRRMPLQGRLFLSARIVGFYANFFGHKTKFFFLWEDIEDIQVIPPSFATIGSPALFIILRSGHGHDARHGAKSQDEEGRLRFQFQSFVSFNIASRTIMALWRKKTLNSEQCAKLEEDQLDQCGKFGHSTELEEDQHDQGGSFGQVEDKSLGIDGTSLSKAFSSELPVRVELLMEIFSGGQLEKEIMEKVGCLNYSATQWEVVRPNQLYERHIRYKFNRHISIFGGEVTSIQHKTTTSDCNGWIVDEVVTLHNVPFGDHFRVHLKYTMIETLVSDSLASQCDIFVGITRMKSTKFKKRIMRNICDKLTHRSKEIFELAEREILSSAQTQE